MGAGGIADVSPRREVFPITFRILMRRIPMRMLAILFAFATASGGEASVPAAIRFLPESFGPASQPDLAVDEGGTVHAVFGASKGRVFVASLKPGDGAFSEPFLVVQAGDMALGNRRGPRIAAAGKALVVTFVVRPKGDLVAYRSSDRGKTWKGPLRLNPADGSSGEGLHAMAATPSGEVFVAWLDAGEAGDKRKKDLYFARSTNEGKTFSRAKPLYRSPSGSICPCCHPSLASGSDGSVVAQWRNDLDGGRDMFVAAFDPKEGTFPNPLQLDVESWKIQTCPMDGGGIAVGSDGKPRSVWRRNTLLLAKQGEAAESRLGQGKDPSVASGPSGTLALWVSGDRISGKNLDKEGEAVRLPEPPAGAMQGSPAVVALPKGGFLAAWEERTAKGATAIRAVRIP
jgi:hypothetical protein